MSSPVEEELTYYTINHDDTHEPLGLGGRLDRATALSIIRARRRGDDGRPFAPSEWYVTAWRGDGREGDEIIWQCSADEFAAADGRVDL